ncbi:GCN5 family acetyltransferase [Pseudomonas sp. 21]|uniref:GNAT family N-acetyltransferase n=1 Tax=unclassified Pseudomonas TaxID=196821 RepID=UPI0005EB3423|nr:MULTISPECIES: GNAT family N-acetyltransferase [unclassified Pseudomonas]KJK03092.1 GCN5 family acetyltransferase [Pseudomonas sp. 21]MBV7586131.1 GNAT family N-acetyltransferase [Pseudomonas sp. PDM33]
MSLSIRPASPTDVDTLFDIRTSVRENHLSREQMAGMGITPQVLAEAIESAPCAWIAEIDGVAGGFAMVDTEAGELFALFVRPECEGLGMGRLLLAAAEEQLFREHGNIWLVTDGGNGIRANAFYRRHGWHLAGRVDERDVRYGKSRP